MTWHRIIQHTTDLLLQGYDGIKDDDSIIFYNFRTDRPRQITKAIILAFERVLVIHKPYVGR